jgi:RNA polymerase sigma-70 factor (ECF subfamily)
MECLENRFTLQQAIGMSNRRRRFEAQALPHLDAAYNLARWLARPPLDADDIVQDAMLRAFRAFDTVRGEDVKPWLMSIVRNCFLTAAGQTKHKLSVPIPGDAEIGADDSALIANQPDPEDSAIQTDEKNWLDGVIASLPPDFREVLVLREMEDMSYKEIAQITKVPVGTVMSRLARARALLKEKCHLSVKGGHYAVQ